MTETRPSRAVEEALIIKHRAEAEKFQAEALRANIEAKQARTALRDAQIDLRQKLRIETELLALDSYNYTYRFNGDVSDSSVKACIDKLTFWHRTKPVSGMEIVFNSQGGSLFAGMDLFDYIQELRREDHYITTHGRGEMASMGGILLQAGNKRSMGKESYILIHEVSAWAAGKIGEIQDEMKFLEKISERVVDIFVSRAASSAAEHPITRAQLKKNWHRTDWWLDSTEAQKLGIVDELR